MTTLAIAVQGLLGELGTWPAAGTSTAQLEALNAAGLPTPVSGDARTRAGEGGGAPRG
jgi:hypothetical protein